MVYYSRCGYRHIRCYYCQPDDDLQDRLHSISEAIRLNLWPKLRIRYPSEEKGQLFIPGINFLLFAGCVGMVLYFKESSRMEAAYGLAIICTMFTTTILFANYMVAKRRECRVDLFISCCVLYYRGRIFCSAHAEIHTVVISL